MAWEIILGLLVVAVSIFAIIYCWAGIIFLYQRLSRSETEERAKAFLNSYRGFLTGATSRDSQNEITRPILRKKGKRYWSLVPSVFILLLFGVNLVNVLLAIAMLFFSGLFLGLSWYGQHCLTVLNLPSFPFTEPLSDFNPQLEKVRERRTFWTSISILAVGLFVGNIYIFLKDPVLLPWWMPILSLGIFGFATHRLYQKLMTR
jgi:hypothetical protein